jgi:NADH:ubiquinone oxidoreductase subunit 4 (subunit M)
MLYQTPCYLIVAILTAALLFTLSAPVCTARQVFFIRAVALTASFAALIVGIFIGLSLDKSSVGYQFMLEYVRVDAYNTALALGVDGLSYVFLVLTLFTFPFLFLAA